MPFNAFFNSFKSSSYLLYSYPIKVALFERKISVKRLVKIMQLKGFVYNYDLLYVSLSGRAFNNFNLNYFVNIYNVLGLPLPTPDYLYKSWLRWEEIKEIKRQSAIANKALKALKADKKN